MKGMFFVGWLFFRIHQRAWETFGYCLLLTLSACLVPRHVFADPIAFELGLPTETAVMQTGNLIGSLEIADIDNDGFNDLITIGGPQLTLSRGSASGSFSPPEVLLNVPPLHFSAVALADMDNDGDLDLIFSLVNVSTILLYLNDGAGNFFLPVPINTGAVFAQHNTPSSLTILDINSDGFQDVLFLYLGPWQSQAMILMNSGGSSSNLLIPQPPITLDLFVTGVAAGDIDNDGMVDLAFSSNQLSLPGVTNVLMNEGNGGFSKILFPLPGRSGDVEITDLDGDGANEVIFSLDPGNGTGPGAAASPLGYGIVSLDQNGAQTIEYINLPYRIKTFKALDVNEDGFIDLVGRSSYPLEALVIVNGAPGQEILEIPIVHATNNTNYYSILAVGDANNDGEIDILTEGSVDASANPNMQRIAIYRQLHIPCGDVNGDGKVNIADVMYLLGYFYQDFQILVDDNFYTMNVNGDNYLNIADVIRLLDHLLPDPGQTPPELQCAEL